MNKRGQFYLLAAMVIIAIITAFAAVSNYAQKQSSVKVYDLGEELGIESGFVLEYGTTPAGESQEDLISGFIEEYQTYAGENKNLYFIFGDYDGDVAVMVSYIKVVSGTVSTDVSSTGESAYPIEDISGRVEELKIEKDAKDANIHKVFPIINGIKYPFELKPGENFFFVISQEIGGETHIVTS